MDELLALTAAHKSSSPDFDEATRATYRVEATRLQTRALSHLNLDQVEVSDENCVQLFVFAAILGEHALFNAFSSIPTNPPLSDVLDELVQCLSLHHGIAFIAGAAMHSTVPLMKELLSNSRDLPHEVTSPAAREELGITGTECDDLKQRLEASEGDMECYLHAASILQYLFDMASRRGGQVIAVQEWMVRVRKDYAERLRQRRPEALVVVAYYGVLLHRGREYWAIGDAGGFLIRAITRHLGTYWAEWLAWPNEMLCA